MLDGRRRLHLVRLDADNLIRTSTYITKAKQPWSVPVLPVAVLQKTNLEMAFRSLSRPLRPIGSRTFFNLSVLDSLSRKEYSERQLLK